VAVTATGEKRTSNATANSTVPADPAAIQWNPAYSDWPAFVSDRNQVTGNFKGTTDEIIQWAACKWGIDVDVARADAWLESGWYMSTRSGCNAPAAASFGLFQIVAEDCNGNLVHGGWPYVQDDSGLNADYWGAWIRGCFDGAFLVPNHLWQTSPAEGYQGHSMAQVVAQNGEDYALWGCIGAWFSNSWYSSSAQGYINIVKSDEASKPWLQPGT
jgi:autotransporter family porin